MKNPPAEELLPTDEPGLVAHIADLTSRHAELDKRIRELMDLEKPGQGIFMAAEIHQAKHTRTITKFQIDFCKARLNQLRGAGR